MAHESSGSGDPARTIALLWGLSSPTRRGPKPTLTGAEVIEAAIALADAEIDLAAVSMRRVADSLGVSTMSLYTYVASRVELVEAMIDKAYGEAVTTLEALDTPDWRAGLTAVADASWELYARHPWMLQVFTGRPPLGPNAIAKYDLELRVIEDIGLTDVEMDAVLTLVHAHVEGIARRRVESAQTERRTGLTDAQWWEVAGPALAKVFDPGQFPLAARVGQRTGERHQAAHDPEHAYWFGLERLMDGVASFVNARE